MTRQYLVLIIISILILACKRTHERINYRVESKDLANFSVQFPELQPKEKILIKINNEIILEDTTNNPIGNSGFWRYYYYKDKIVKIEFLDFFNGDLKVNKVFKDTLTDVKQRTLIVSRPYPKGLTKEMSPRFLHRLKYNSRQ